ncbi:MAG: lytic transglycosylase domain-containing protein [Sphingobium sp.]|nr:lytic transglycosylase domain-containing protein [Sphingobium sp.]
MASLKLGLAVGALVLAMPAQAQTTERWRPYITQASLRCGVPTAWIERVMRAESDGQTALGGRPIRSRAGAMGLMQLMPGTWDAMRRTLGLGPDPDHPPDNILAGTCYLRQMYDRFGYPGLFAAYNAGPARYAEHLATGRRLSGETVAYLHAVGGVPSVASGTVAGMPREALFAIQYPASNQPESTTPVPSPASLFVLRHDGQ